MPSWLELVYPEAPDARAQFAADMESLRAELVWPEPPSAAADHTGFKHWLIDNGLTQEDLAKQCGTTRQHLYRVTTGRRPNPKLRRKLNELGVPAELLGLKEAH